MSMTEQPTANVLRARPERIALAVLEPDPEDGTLVASTGRETRLLRFDANVIADLEDAFDGLEGWAAALGMRADNAPEAPEGSAMPRGAMRALIRTLAIALGDDERTMGRRVIISEIPNYLMAVSAAFAIGQGMDPTEVAAAMGDLGERAAAAVDEARGRLGTVPVSPNDGQL